MNVAQDVEVQSQIDKVVSWINHARQYCQHDRAKLDGVRSFSVALAGTAAEGVSVDAGGRAFKCYLSIEPAERDLATIQRDFRVPACGELAVALRGHVQGVVVFGWRGA